MERELAFEFVIEMRSLLNDGNIRKLHELTHEYNTLCLLDYVAIYRPDDYKDLIRILNN